MKRSLLVSALVLGAMARMATAQIIPVSPSDVLVNLDNIPPATNDITTAFPVTNEFADLGVQFAGFGENGGALFNFQQAPTPGISEPNTIVFASFVSMGNGGIPQTPETLTFYPPISYLQFDATTLGQDCQGTAIVTVSGFAADSTPVGSSTTPIPVAGITIQTTFTAPATTVVLTSSHSCGTSGLFAGVEIFTVDNLGFTIVGTGAPSKCAQSAIDAAGKKAKAEASCYSKALQKGVPVDGNCITKAQNTFLSDFNKAGDKGDCLVGGRHMDNLDPSTFEGAVDTMIANTLQTITNGSTGPDICSAKKMASVGKKAQAIAKCWSKAASSGLAVDANCGPKAASSFNGSLKTCGTPDQLGPIEQEIDFFGQTFSRGVTVVTTTTTTTTSTTTTTTQPPPLGTNLSFTTVVGSDCTTEANGGTGPFSGNLFSDTGLTTPIQTLGLGCLYIGAGASNEPPSLIPENSSSIFETTDNVNLVASLGTSRADCTTGPQPTQHCVNNPSQSCSSDADCAGFLGACAFDATCFFGPPVPVSGFPSTCVVNTFASDGSGTIDTTTGDSSVSINLASRVFLSLGQPTPCPQCIGGACTYGDNAGQACTTTNVNQTSLDCMPGAGSFVATLPVNLTPLATGTNTQTAADGIFCPAQNQTSPGAFGQATTEAIQQMGSPSGDLTDGLPHPSTLVSIFCIPATGNLSVDGIADLPGPGSISLPGNAQFTVVP
jgi:hypothetical protein